MLSIFIDSSSNMVNTKAISNQMKTALLINHDEEMKMETAKTCQEFITVDFDSLKVKDYDLENWSVDIPNKDHNYLTQFVAAIFVKDNLIAEFDIDKTKFNGFVAKMRMYYSYHNNPFHNFAHGAGVCHAMSYFIN